MRSRERSIDTNMGYWLDDPGLIAGRGKVFLLFSTAFRYALDPKETSI
jgi:hypothetical protein